MIASRDFSDISFSLTKSSGERSWSAPAGWDEATGGADVGAAADRAKLKAELMAKMN